MPEIEIGTETESATGWSYDVTLYADGRAHRYDVTMSFQDYDLWSHGTAAPSRVVEAAFKFLLAHEPPGEIMSRFDLSVIRRYFPKIDKEIRAYM